MSYRGIIFDFNGVLFWDTHLQEEAWNRMSLELRKKPFTKEEMHHHMHGVVNKNVLEYLLGHKLSIEEAQRLADEKEKAYQKMCLDHKDEFKLSPGAEEFLDYLVKHNIPHTIATSSPKTNVDFFIQYLNLNKWFDVNRIVLDDGSRPGKPAPDIYLKAASNLQLEPKDCIVIEDAKSGIESALNAGVGKIIALGPKEKHETLSHLQGVSQIITSIGELYPDKLF